MSQLRVEPLGGPEDLDAVLAIEAASFHNPTSRAWYEAELARPEVCRIVVLRLPPAGIVGFAAFWVVADEMHLNNFAVHPDWRQRGLGTRLLSDVLAAAAATGARRASLEVRPSNLAARRLYERAGFVVTGVRPGYYSQPVEDALVLSAQLNPPDGDGRVRA